MRRSLLMTSVMTLSIFSACEADETVPSYPERMVRTRDMSMSPPINTAGMQTMPVDAGDQLVAGNEAGLSDMAGDQIAGLEAGTDSGGEAQAGALPAGSMVGGMDQAGVEQGGTLAGQMSAGSEAEVNLSCLGILECMGTCGEDSACVNDCLSRGSQEGIIALNELVDCDVRFSCGAEPNCLSISCAMELSRCELGGPGMGGTEMGGIGWEGQRWRTEMGGQTPPPTGPLSCSGVIDCIETCPMIMRCVLNSVLMWRR